MKDSAENSTGNGANEAWLEAHRVDVSQLHREDIVGIGHVTAEVDGLVARLRDPERARRMGVETPRGILFYGAPGLGKTLVARSVAAALGERVPFYEVSADELTPSRIRGALAYLADAHPRSVLYIDEIDNFGMNRDYGGHDPRTRQLLTAMLAALDGLVPHRGPLIIASSNREPFRLDPALVRAGRLGFRVAFDPPNAAEREQLFRLFARDIPQEPEIPWADFARLTIESSPADLRQVVADAAGLALGAGLDHLTAADVAKAVRRAGDIGPEGDAPSRDWHRSAVHEAGHAIVAAVLRGPDWVQAIQLTDTGGKTTVGDESLLEIDRPDDEIRDSLAVHFGGLVAEQVLLGEAGLGGAADISAATHLAKQRFAAGLAANVVPVSISAFDEFIAESILEAQAVAVTGALDEARSRAVDVVSASEESIAGLAARIEEAGELAGEPLRQAFAAIGLPDVTRALERPRSDDEKSSPTPRSRPSPGARDANSTGQRQPERPEP
jgi:cell division protease FtsH